MSSISIIAIIIVLLACLVCYAFVSQTLEQKRQHRQRLLTALQIKARNFKFMLNSFPGGFLPRDLALLVQRSLVDACEQLIELDPKDPTPKQDLQAVTQQMTEAPQQPEKVSPVMLESTQQVKEVKQCLEELYRVIHHQESRNTLNSREAEVYRTQIRQLLLSVTVDAYIIQGHAARQREKIRLAEHYFTVALKLLAREDTANILDAKKLRLQSGLENVRTQLQALTPSTPAAEEEEQAEIDKAWARFSEAEENWKKKNVYD